MLWKGKVLDKFAFSTKKEQDSFMMGFNEAYECGGDDTIIISTDDLEIRKKLAEEKLSDSEFHRDILARRKEIVAALEQLEKEDF